MKQVITVIAEWNQNYMKQIKDLLQSYETNANNLKNIQTPVEFFKGLNDIANIITQISVIRPGLTGKSKIKKAINRCHEINNLIIKEFLIKYCDTIISTLQQCKTVNEAYKIFDDYNLIWKYKSWLSHENQMICHSYYDKLLRSFIVKCYNIVVFDLPQCNTIDAVRKKLDEFYSINRNRYAFSKECKALFSNCFDKLQSHKANTEKAIREREEQEKIKAQKEFAIQNSINDLPSSDKKSTPNAYLKSKMADIVQEKSKEKHFDSMGGLEFEHFCADLLRKNGYVNVKTTNGSGDNGVDIFAEKDDVTYAIQCKRYGSPVGNKAIQEIYSGKSFYKCDVGVVMTNQFFTPAARKVAKELGIKRWDRKRLEKMRENAGI